MCFDVVDEAIKFHDGSGMTFLQVNERIPTFDAERSAPLSRQWCYVCDQTAKDRNDGFFGTKERFWMVKTLCHEADKMRSETTTQNSPNFS